MLSLVKNIFYKPHLVRCVTTAPQKWDLFSAVSLERLPIVTRELKEVEAKFLKMLQQIEFERSAKSDFELRKEADEQRAKELESGADLDLDSQPQQTAQDMLDASKEELNRFKFAPRLESSEVENNVKSLLRAKDRRLLLLVKDESIGGVWLLPQGKYQGEPSLRATAERVLSETCGPNLNVKWMGNAPAGFYKYRYPKSVRRDAVGAKVFFFKAQLVDGALDNKRDFQWATRNELKVLNQDYKKSVDMFLLDEKH